MRKSSASRSGFTAKARAWKGAAAPSHGPSPMRREPGPDLAWHRFSPAGRARLRCVGIGWVLGALLLGACSDPTDVQPFPGRCGAFELVEVTPADQALGVPTNTPIELVFSDYPDPDSLGSPSVILTTGVYWYPGTYSVDLIDKRVRFRTPGALRPFLGYTINLTATLRSLQGCPTMAKQLS